MTSINYQENILRILDTKVASGVRRLNSEMRLSFNKMIASAAGEVSSELIKTIAPAISTITFAALFGLHPGRIVLLGGASLQPGG